MEIGESRILNKISGFECTLQKVVNYKIGELGLEISKENWDCSRDFITEPSG